MYIHSEQPTLYVQALTQLVYRVLVVQAACALGYSMSCDTGCHSIHDLVVAHSDSDSMHPAMPPRLLPFLRRACILQRQVMNRSMVSQLGADLHCDKQAASSEVSPGSSTHHRLFPQSKADCAVHHCR